MIEWLASSHFSFLEGASAPGDLARAASQAGYAGFGLADRMSLSGLVRGLSGADEVRETLKEKNPQAEFFYAPGIRLHFDAADPLFVFPLHRRAHAELCAFLSKWALDGMSHGEKGLTPLPWRAFRDFLRENPARTNLPLADNYVIVSVSGRFYPWVAEPKTDSNDRVQTQDVRAPTPSFSVPPTLPGHTPFYLLELVDICGAGPESALSLAYPLNLAPGNEDLLNWLEDHSLRLGISLLATSLPLFARKNEQDLCDLVTAIRHTRKLCDLGYLRQANNERRFLSPQELSFYRALVRERFEKHPQAPRDPFARTHELAARHRFSLLELRYRYPRERVPAGESPADYLTRLTWEGAQRRYPQGIAPEVEKQIRHELDLIHRLEYEDYFLTIYDTLNYARERRILHQGRGSAANSVVCYCLEITAIDPVRMGLLFERFLSNERREPPDIDVDFEHERREEVIQEMYRRYGREHAAMVSTYICFRGRMAIRETAKAFGFTEASVEELAVYMGREGMSRLRFEQEQMPADLAQLLKKHAIAPARWRNFLELAEQLKGSPRHLSIHTGGFVLSSEKLSEQCVLEPARMENRSVIPWDKDDVDYLGWMKVDLLSLGMLSAIRKSFDYVGSQNATRAPLTLASIPQDDTPVYEAMCRADTVGVFQIESRAQMNMLPRLAPRNFYDIVVEVAIVRPGPIQGGMVHPYLQRRRLPPDQVKAEHPALEPILKKTLGVPIFQEQVMKIAVAVAGFTPGEADLLRKAMSGAWRSKSRMHEIRERLFAGMRAQKISDTLADRLYKQIEGFGEYGFPESHAASFALLTYASQWLKVHHPAEFLCALLNSQPMGFYSPRALVHDAERHGVRVLPIDLVHSRWDSTLAPDANKPGVRLGLHLVPKLSKTEAQRIEKFQDNGFFATDASKDSRNLRDLAHAGLPARTIEALVRANAAGSLRKPEAVSQSATGDPRRHQLWDLYSIKNERPQAPLLEIHEQSATPFIEPMDEWTSMLKDFQSVGLTPGKHPATYARERFFKNAADWKTAEGIYLLARGTHAEVVGLLSIKQRPPTATGMTFLTLEDETGFMNLVLKAEVYEQCRLVIESSPMLAAYGRIERSLPWKADDPRTAAVSIQVERLWNPFLPGTGLSGSRYKPRHYH